MCPRPQIKSGVVQSVKPSQEVESYIVDTDGGETAAPDNVAKAVTDNAAPLAVEDSPAAWAVSTVYAKGDQVTESSIKYICVTGHTSDAADFANDAANWEVANYNGDLAQGVFDIDMSLNG